MTGPSRQSSRPNTDEAIALSPPHHRSPVAESAFSSQVAQPEERLNGKTISAVQSLDVQSLALDGQGLESKTADERPK